jgi:tetratricopeptide (TPR) repeat protein
VAHAVAALTGFTIEQSRAQLDVPTGAYLVQPGRSGRYGMHDLLKAYALEQARQRDAETPAPRRLLSWYLHSAAGAAKAVNSLRPHVALASPEPGVTPAAFETYTEGLGWLETEYDNLLAAVAFAAREGEYEVAWKLPHTMWDIFLLRGNVGDWITTDEIGLASARMLGDARGTQSLLNHLALAYGRSGRHEDTLQCLLESLALAREANDGRLIAIAMQNIGITLAMLGRLDEALQSLQEGLAGIRTAGDRLVEARMLLSLGSTYRMRQEFAEALDQYQVALEKFRASGDRTTQAETLLEMSMVRLELNQLDDAYRDAAEAAELSSEAGGQYFLAKATAVLGKVALARRRPGQARQHFHDAIEVFIELGMSAEADNITSELGRC